MRLLRIVSSMNPSSGGISAGIRGMHQNLKDLNISIKIICFDDPHSPWANDCDGDIICLGPVNNKYGYKINLESQIRSIACNFDVAIIEGIWSYHSFVSWKVFRSLKIPYVVFTHGMLDPWFKRTYPLKHLKKSIYWPFTDFRVLKDAYAVLFTTSKEKELASKSFRLYKANELVVGYGTSAPPSDVNGQKELFLNRFPSLRNKRILLFLSRIHPKKGIDLLIEAFAKIAKKDLSLCLVIAGPDQIGIQSKLQSQVISAGVDDQVVWTGMLDGDYKWGALRCSELFCLPSHQENFGVVVAEALACGLPVAISHEVNIASDVAQYNAGFTFEDTVAGTTLALDSWLLTPETEISNMRCQSIRLFSDMYNFEIVAQNIYNVLSSSIRSSQSH